MSGDDLVSGDDEAPDRDVAGGPSLPVKIFVGVVATLTLLLFGAAGGLLISVTSDGRSAEEPSPVDIGFAQDMTIHHEQAVTMATLARERGAAVDVRQLAFDIETNQRDQIGRMQGWLSLWGQPAQTAGAPMAWMSAGGAHEGHGGTGADSSSMLTPDGRMPGMATSAELGKLRQVRGPEFDVLFLQLMLRHHQGGVGMAEYGRDHGAIHALQQLAENMLGSQGKERMLMNRMLTERGAKALPLQ